MRRPSQLNPKIPSFLDGLVEQCLEPEVARRTITAELIRDRLIAGVQGAHLAPARRERAMQGITQVKEKFALLDVLRETRFGAVYLFENRLTRQLLVIKKLADTHRGFAESRQLSALAHPNIVRVHGVSKNDKLYIVVMDYVAGGSLLDRLVQPWPWREATATMHTVCKALAFAHRHHIVHGNLRPSNILFTEQGEPCLTDFCLDEHYREGMGAGNWYSVPGEAPSSGADIFSAGAIFHEVLTGSLPAWGGDGRLVIDQKLRALPVDLQNLLTRMLDRKPDRRARRFEEILPTFDALIARPSDARPTVTRQAAGMSRMRIALLFLLLAATAVAATLYLTGRLALG
jgi:serine/threonine-protein kinase